MNYDEFIMRVSSLIAAIDQKISVQLSEIMHHPRFVELESNWSSIRQMISTDYSKSRVKVRMIDMTWSEISRDLNLSYNIKNSRLYYKIYSRELNTAGGLPFGILAVSHRLRFECDDDFDDIYTAQLLGELGQACLCPVLVGIEDRFFGDSQDVIMHDVSRLGRIVESDDFNSWENLRKSRFSRFLNVVMPDYLIRKKYERYKSDFVFTEQYNNQEQPGLWGNSVFLLAMNVIREFTRVSWFGFLRAYDEKLLSGAIVQLPGGDKIVPKISFCAENDSEWADNGLTVLSNVYLTDYYAFFSNSSVARSNNEQEKITNMMQTNLMACRFSHYVKVLLRDKIGNYDTPAQCKAFLSDWLSNYVMNSSFSDESMLAKYPLKSYSVEVVENPSDPTVYDCSLKIEPQYQYDLSTAVLKLVTSVRSGKSARDSGIQSGTDKEN